MSTALIPPPPGFDVDVRTRLQLSLIIPTFCERDNIPQLLARLQKVLGDLRWEAIFVDDNSPDGTAEVVRRFAVYEPRIHCLLRIGRRGLSSACTEGILASSADIVGVMDADLQHDESILPSMLDLLLKGDADIVVATRYGSGGSLGQWTASRALMSRIATRLSALVCKRPVTDPMSGFFLLRRRTFVESADRLSGMGFKILMDLLATAPRELALREVPYTFRTRAAGESKMDLMVAWEFGMLLADKLVGRFIPVRLLSFSIIGGLGVGIHLTILAIFFDLVGSPFAAAQTIATAGAMTSNFALNNLLTYRDRRLHGWHWFRGLLVFYAVCSVGAVANVGIASHLHGTATNWIVSALAGIAVGTVWNYAASNAFAWRSHRHK